MSESRYINTKFWNDNFIVELDPIERYLFLYFLTNEHTNIAGVYELPIKRMEQETGLEKEMLLKIIERFKDKINYFEGWVYIKNFSKNQKLSGKNIDIAIKKLWGLVPEGVYKPLTRGMDTPANKGKGKGKGKGNINKPSPIGDAKNMPLKEYNENVSPSEGLEEISSETNELIKEDPRLKKAGKVNQKFWELIKWAENRRGGKFPSWKLQLKALSQLKDADIGPVDIKDRWAELENDKFYKNNLDFRSIAISFDKKPL